MKIILANPRGFCAGVDRAVEIVEKALALFDTPIYVRHAVVHNQYVVMQLKEKGVIFIEELKEIPEGNVVIFSAHGVAQSVREEALQRKLHIHDATCPLVTKVHMEVARYQKQGRECVLIGHRGHPEVIGILGQYISPKKVADTYVVESIDDVWKIQVKNPDVLGFVTQTTLSVDDTAEIVVALRQRFPKITGPKKADICYATQNRQEAIQRLGEQCDLILVVGSTSSSNATRLLEIAQRAEVESYLINDADAIKRTWLVNKQCIGVTAGASSPEILVQGVLCRLQEWGCDLVEEAAGVTENIIFPVPKELLKS